jgi:beta-lactamase superfamily II metal-dependent hydrolase
MKAHFTGYGHVHCVAVSLMIVTADVGAGYTGVLVGPDETALIDFGGERRSGPTDALSRVSEPYCWPWWGSLRTSRVDPRPFDAFLLSHPHEDHYNGLLAFARQRRNDQTLPPLLTAEAPFYHPRLPTDRVAAEFLAREVALERVMTGRPEDALIRVLSQCAGRQVPREPLSQGDTVTLAGEPFDVLWPPKVLPPHATAQLHNLVQRYNTLADRAEADGDSSLKRALDRLPERDTGSIEDVVYGSAETSREDDQQWLEQGEHDLTDKPPVQDSDDSRHTKRLRDLQKAVTNGANLLSLVLASEVDRRYVFLGDIDESLHGAIAPALVEFTPEVVSSAHHGTHFGSALKKLHSRYVVSSVGGKLENNVCSEYDSMGMHLRTDKAGDIFALMLSGRTAVWTRPTP